MSILGYTGIMEKKMETTIIQYIIGYILGGPYSVRAMLYLQHGWSTKVAYANLLFYSVSLPSISNSPLIKELTL